MVSTVSICKAKIHVNEFWRTIKRIVSATNKGLPLTLALILVVIPMAWVGQLYFVGGDNSQLYYLMPRAMMDDYLFNIVSDNSLGTLGVFAQQSYQAPFFGLLHLLKSVLPNVVNLQGLSFGINFAFSFLGFYWLLGLWIKSDNVNERLIKAIAGIAYCSSLFVVSTMWKHALYAVYLTALYPLVLYLFLRGVREQSLRYVIMAALLATLFSIVLMAVPWLAGTLLVTLPLLIWHQIEYRRTFHYLVYFVIILVGLNAFWLGAMVYSVVSPGGVYDTLASPEMNVDTIRHVTGENNIAYPLLGDSMPRWVAGIDKVWFGLLPSTSILALVIIAAGIFARESRQLFGIYIAGVACWILAIYFYTVRIGGWGYSLFITLNSAVPGFTMFRNNFDKFSIGIAFAFALLVGISLSILVRQPFWQNHEKARRSLLFTLFALVILQAWPFLRGGLWDKPMWTTTATFNTISRFNGDFNELVAYLKQQPGDSKYLWLPLNNAGYIQIADAKLSNHYYSGTSPLRFLADKSDYTGRFSFGSQAVGDQLFQNIVDGQLDKVTGLFRTMNIGYVIVNNDLSRDIISSYLYGMYSPGDLYRAQLSFLKPLILGEHVRDFGNRYSLYKIKPDLLLSKIHFAESPMGGHRVKWHKVSSSEYSLTLDDLNGLPQLTFLEPFDSKWRLTTRSGLKLTSPLAEHTRNLGYANAWQLDPVKLAATLPETDYSRAPDGSLSLDLKLEFAPARWLPYGIWVSGIALAACLLYMATGLIRRRGAA